MTRKWRANYRRAVAPMAAMAALVGLSYSPSAHAIPNLLTVQGLLTNEAGTAVNGTYDVKFSLYTAQTGGTLLWDETETGLVVTNGIFDDVIGDVDPVSDPLRVDYFRNNAEVWLQLELEAGPGVAVNEAPLPRQLMTSSAFAFAAHHATTATTATSASTATTATTATTAATATTSQGLTCAGACVSITELDFDPATQAELTAAVANMVTTASLNTTLGGYVTTGALNTALQSYATVSSLAGYATVGALSAYATTASVNTAITTALGPYSTTAATSTAITTALAPYATTAATTTAINTALAPYATTAATTTAINTALQPYATTAATTTAINTALAPYATTAATTTAIGTALQPYSTTAQTTTAISTALQPYSTTAATTTAISTALQPYSTTAATTTAISTALQPYSTTTATTSAISTALQPYSTTAQTTTAISTALTPYATSTAVTTAIAAALSPYSTTSVMNSAITTALSGYVTSTQLTTLLAAYALKTELPTSISDLTGGTVTGNVAATGTVEGVVVKQNGQAVCDTSGNCGPTLNDFACEPGQSLQWNGSEWECGAGGGGGAGPSQPCTGAYKALQYDGNNWNCIDIRASGLSGGRGNGYEVIDAWGYAWDGLERGAKTWDLAQAECVSVGARLPTVTELFRNNATTGTGNLGTTANTSELWTLILNISAQRMTVRVSDGGINGRAPTSSYNFRCVWPNRTTASFDGNSCYGPAGSECAQVRRWYNMDHYVRPPLDMVSATQECAFYNASIPMVEDWTEAIHSGVLTSNFATWQWSGEVMGYTSAPHVLHPLIKFDAARAKFWTYDNRQNAFADWAWPYSTYGFRCIGKRPGVGGVNPAVMTCNGGCFSVGQSDAQVPDKPARRAQMWADNKNRTAATRAVASEQCAAAGGTLPTVLEFSELVRAGWAFDTTAPANEHTAWLWTNTPFYYPGGYYNMMAKRHTGAALVWSIHHSNTVTWDLGNLNYAYRCVWHQTQRSAPFTCPAGQDMNWDGTQYSCSDRVLGTSNGQALEGPWNDNWGNEWDYNNRPAATAANAAATCSGLGGRLPTATELYRVRAGGPNTIPFTTAVYSWTNLPGYNVDHTTTVRLSDGTTSQTNSSGANTLQYRCIWPVSKGTVFGGSSCSGPTNANQDPCFRAGRYVNDKQDRAAMSPSAAAEECKFYGGWLQGLRGFEELVHLGNPNGNFNVWSWIMEPMYASNYYQGIARWSGAGTAAWFWHSISGPTQTGSLAGPEEVTRTFRCAFHDIIR